MRDAAAAILVIAATSLLSAGIRQSVPSGTAAGQPRFSEVAGSAGLTFVHRHSPTPDKHYPESVPGGVAVFDYNGDGRPDIFFTNGARDALAREELSDIRQPALSQRRRHEVHRRHRCGRRRRSRLCDGRRCGGLRQRRPRRPVRRRRAANQLLHNRGDGRSRTSPTRRGIASGEWAVGGGWFDYDNDGRLDLLVVHYVHWSPQTNASAAIRRAASASTAIRAIFQGLPNRLYRNRGDGTFEDVSAQRRHRNARRQGHERRLRRLRPRRRRDAFVTNDTVPELPFATTATARSRKSRSLAGVALPDSGRPISSMGADFQDYDNDGWEDIHLTALAGETFPLFRNDCARRQLQSRRRAERPRPADGAAVGLVLGLRRCRQRRLEGPLHRQLPSRTTASSDFEAIGWQQPNSLFVNDGDGRFRDATATPASRRRRASTAAAASPTSTPTAALDIVVLVLGDRAELWHNETGNGNALADRATDRHHAAIATASARASSSATRSGP